ncbi:amino acid racemase [Qipengyuania sp. JC766]|uniref:aspartate/glutamate racemase family protein n=1 Tax=Qipengyuania sp. JC766 TaxID=3232139 RepID=UPI0034593139
MRKLGLIGGMSWVSTRTYYETINRKVQRRAEPMASAPLLIESLDFRTLYGLRDGADWDRAAGVLIDSARRLERAGAEGLAICANSMHRVYDRVAEAVSIPILHIADCVGQRMAQDEVTSAAMIGTRNVMTESFYRERLVAHGIELLPPDMETVDGVDALIYEQLMLGKATRDAERLLKTVITRKEQEGAKAIVLACTELELVVDIDANVLPIYDSARIHCEAAVDWIFGERS